MDIREKVKSLPTSPGVYIMKDAAGRILYIGKAKSLRKRVVTYFAPAHRLAERIASMVAQVAEVTHIPTATEAEALIYENSLIKQFSPKYNVALKDGKSYPFLKLTVDEPFPRLFVTRSRKADGARYYGPYTDVALLRQAVAILQHLFPLRRCRSMGGRVCLDYHIKQCLGPCTGAIDRAQYGQIVRELELFLEGKTGELLRSVTERMQRAAAAERYEEAARLRDRLVALGSLGGSTIRYTAADELAELAAILGLKHLPKTIEAFDVSNIMGTNAVGSMISFSGGRPRKSAYRLFKVKGVRGIDDYAMIREIVSRRYRRALAQRERLPDLILIDGGKAHLNVALDELEKLGITEVPVIGLAKEFERIYVRDKDEPLILPKASKALHLLERVRDEAHRFAISFHKRLMSRAITHSELDDVPGIGPKRRWALMKRFGTVDRIRHASREELCTVEGIYEKQAQRIVDHLRK